MSGRGLGFTGGTRDKLESIPGYNTAIDIDEFISNVKKDGISLMGQTLNLAPADKKLYALRDSIACVDNIALIASSIMSKKIAAGANKIVLEVTVGDGAFMKTKEDAEKLSKLMIRIGELCKKEVVCILTNMSEPIGYSIGNTLEVIEAVQALKGNMEEDVKEIVLNLGAYMLKLANKGNDIEENKKMILQNIENGKAYNKETLKKAKYKLEVVSDFSGYVEKMKVEQLGKASCILGAGRIKKDDEIEYEVGLIIKKKIGDFVQKGDILAEVYANDLRKGNEIINMVKDCYTLTGKKILNKPTAILGIIE